MAATNNAAEEEQKQQVIVAEKRYDDLRSLALIESAAAAEIIERLTAEVELQKHHLRELATTLKIPRLHLDYIKQHGVA